MTTELREVKPLEINKELRFLSDHIFGYAYGHQIASHSGKPLETKLEKIKIDDLDSRFLFRIEKISENQIELIGYLSDEAESELCNWQNNFEKGIILTPFQYNEFKNLVRIKFDNYLSIQSRSIEQSNGMKMTILELKRSQSKTEQNITKQLSIKKEFKEGFLSKIFWKLIVPILVIVVAGYLLYYFNIK